MKKNRILFLPLIIIALFSLNSCNSNESIDGFVENTDTSASITDPANPSNPTTSGLSTGLLKKTISIDPTGQKFTTVYNYNGNKLVSIIEDAGGENTYVTYTGDLITKLEYKMADGTLDQVNTYAYNTDGKLTTYVRIDPSSKHGNKEVYTYNADGSVSVTEYIGDDKTQTQANSTSTIKFVDGEVSEITSSNSPNHKYVYDTKKNPLNNILGWSKIQFTDGEAGGISHNIISDTSGSKVWSCVYTYNSDSYPSTCNETDVNGEKFSDQFFY